MVRSSLWCLCADDVSALFIVRQSRNFAGRGIQGVPEQLGYSNSNAKFVGEIYFL